MKKNLSVLLLAFVMIFSTAFPVFASNSTDTSNSEEQTWEVNTDSGVKSINFSPESLHEYNNQLINGTISLSDVTPYRDCWAIIYTTNHGSVYVYDDCTVPGAGSYYVKLLQCCLNDLGYNAGTADGIYGSNTKAAIERFQRKNKLTVDGIAGEMTWRYLDIRCNDRLSKINF